MMMMIMKYDVCSLAASSKENCLKYSFLVKLWYAKKDHWILPDIFGSYSDTYSADECVIFLYCLYNLQSNYVAVALGNVYFYVCKQEH